MVCLRWRYASWLACIMLSSFLVPAMANERAFPFDRELMFDAAPMSGSKRIPMIEIGENGAVSIDLWCASMRGQANVGEDSISIVPGQVRPAQCAPDPQSGDENLLAALAQGNELAAPRGRDRAPRRDDAAISPDDELTASADHTLVARVIKSGMWIALSS